jgi:hypothetical protein
MIIGRDPDRKRQLLKKSRKQERRTADTYRGSRNAGSGAGWVRKNDVRNLDFLFENKFTANQKTITLKSSDLRELRENALAIDRIPVLQFDLANHRYVVLIEDDFLEMINHDSV